jgi:hypothetical protein
MGVTAPMPVTTTRRNESIFISLFLFKQGKSTRTPPQMQLFLTRMTGKRGAQRGTKKKRLERRFLHKKSAGRGLQSPFRLQA